MGGECVACDRLSESWAPRFAGATWGTGHALGVPVMGTLGIVLMACRKSFIPQAVPVLLALRAAGLRLDDRIIKDALAKISGETWEP